ncbi:3-keto-5-aminohexanoate cleavage protein [Marinobacterium sp. YM272]|uniref:3-keto-5-aminohexanoate cleavage protein n=1 Tax=Marinobacterium sp. YM272 TaxID=3421654 RepID=UPI003D7FDE02
MRDERLIIVAPNGARRTHSDHPALPVSPEEIADTVAACVEAGAAMVHLHARDQLGGHSLEISDNAAVMEEVRRRVGDRVVVQLTTEAVGRYQPAQQMALIRALEPEAASFALRELIPSPEYESDSGNFFHWVAERNILAQYILYSEQDLRYYLDLLERGLLPSRRHHLLFVLGRYSANQQSTPEDLAPFIELLPRLNDRRWAICAFGAREQECLLAAAQKGGDLRIGFENNLLKPDGDLAASNADQVRDLVAALEKSGYTPTGVSTLRAESDFQ